MKQKNQYKALERVYLKIYEDDKYYEKEQRFKAICNIYQMDKFFKPRTKIEDVYL